MYFDLAARVADAVDLLVKAQQAGEASYIEEQSHVISLALKSRAESDTEQ